MYVQVVVEPVPVDKLSARSLIIIFNHMSNFSLIIHSCWKQSRNDVHFQENTSVRSRTVHVCLLSARGSEIFCTLGVMRLIEWRGC